MKLSFIRRLAPSNDTRKRVLEPLTDDLCSRDHSYSKKLGSKKQWNLQVPFQVNPPFRIYYCNLTYLLERLINSACHRENCGNRAVRNKEQSKRSGKVYCTLVTVDLFVNAMTPMSTITFSVTLVKTWLLQCSTLCKPLQMALADFTVFWNPTFLNNYDPASINRP